MALVEATLVLEQVPIPPWLLPYNTTHDIILLLHRLYPAYMNGVRCIIGAFIENHKGRRVAALFELNEAAKAVTQKTSGVIQSTISMAQNLEHLLPVKSTENGVIGGSNDVHGGGVVTMSDALHSVVSRTSGLHSGVETHQAIESMTKKAGILKNPSALRRYEKEQSGGSDWIWLRNLAIYLIARFILIRATGGSKDAAAAMASKGR